MDPDDPAQGLFLTDPTGHPTKLPLLNKPTSATLYATVPPDLTGPQRLTLVQNYDGENRPGIYDFLLQPVPTGPRYIPHLPSL